MAIEKSTEEQQNDEQPKKVEKTTDDEQITLSKSDLEALIDSKIKSASASGESGQLIKDLTDSLKTAIQGDEYKKPDEFAYLSPTSIDPDDLVEDGEIFWAAGFHLVIGDDKKNGIAIPPPYKVIDFRPEGSKRKQNGKEVDMQIWSTYMSHSKKEIEWLKNHSLYGIRFFTKSADAMSIDVRYTQKLAEYAQAMRNTEAHRVVAQARELGLVVTDDLETLRLVIAQERAKDYMKQFEENEKIRLKSNTKTDLLTK